jgi:uncharacterized protein (TIGR02266 family)
LTCAGHEADTGFVAALPVVRLRLKYIELEAFIERFASNVTRGGIFIASREPRPVGSEVRFEVQLMNGTAVLTGEGRVTWVKEFNPAEPQRAHGMGVQFTVVDPASRPLLERLLRKREESQRKAAPPSATAPQPASPAVRRPTESRPTEPLPAVPEIDELEDTALRRLVDRARTLSARTEDVEDLLKPEPFEQPATLSEALKEMTRYLNRRTGSGLVRLPPETPADRPKRGDG